MSYSSLVAEALVFLKCDDDVAGGEWPNAGTGGDIANPAGGTPTLVAGQDGNAYDVSHLQAHCQEVMATVSASGDFYLGGWFKGDASEPQQAALACTWGANLQDGFCLCPYSRWSGGSSGKGVQVFWEDADEDVATMEWTASDDPAVEDGLFHYVSLERDGATLSLFFDDVTAAVATAAVVDLTSTPAVFGGGSRFGVLGNYQGVMDEAFLFTRKLTPAERTTLKDRDDSAPVTLETLIPCQPQRTLTPGAPQRTLTPCELTRSITPTTPTRALTAPTTS